MNTRTSKEGVDGIMLWNKIYPKLRDQESSIKLCRELINLKIESFARIDQIIEKWQLCTRCFEGNTSQAIQTFRLQIARMKNDDRLSDYVVKEGPGPQNKSKPVSR